MARKKSNSNIPTFDELFIPTIVALQQLGGSGTIEEINEKVYEIAKIDNSILEIPHNADGSLSEIDYRLAWSRTYLKKSELIDNSVRGIWALTKQSINASLINRDEIKRKYRDESILSLKKKNSKKNSGNANHFEQEEFESIDEDENVPSDVEATEKWKQQLLNVLYNISPSAFERLTQRILRESGFSQVEVTGKTGDGGIDGKGIVRISGFLSFHVIFQCKRYRGSISPDKIRDFRGAMQGRADKGIFITTGKFTREATKEATRDGAPPIDMIDGELLCDKLKELKLGVATKIIETVEIEINNDWFKNI